MTSDARQGEDIEGVDDRIESEVRDPGTLDQPDEGPAMSGAGAGPGGSSMDHWTTASPNTDATKPESMPHTKSTPMPGETEDRTPV